MHIFDKCAGQPAIRQRFIHRLHFQADQFSSSVTNHYQSISFECPLYLLKVIVRGVNRVHIVWRIYCCVDIRNVKRCILMIYIHHAGFIQVSLESNSSLTVEVSTKVELSCVASGYQADMFMYQWRHDGNILINATDKALIIPSVADSDNGRYECAVTNHWGDVVTSNSTELVVTSM